MTWRASPALMSAVSPSIRRLTLPLLIVQLSDIPALNSILGEMNLSNHEVVVGLAAGVRSQDHAMDGVILILGTEVSSAHTVTSLRLAVRQPLARQARPCQGMGNNGVVKEGRADCQFAVEDMQSMDVSLLLPDLVLLNGQRKQRRAPLTSLITWFSSAAESSSVTSMGSSLDAIFACCGWNVCYRFKAGIPGPEVGEAKV